MTWKKERRKKKKEKKCLRINGSGNMIGGRKVIHRSFSLSPSAVGCPPEHVDETEKPPPSSPASLTLV